MRTHRAIAAIAVAAALTPAEAETIQARVPGPHFLYDGDPSVGIPMGWEHIDCGALDNARGVREETLSTTTEGEGVKRVRNDVLRLTCSDCGAVGETTVPSWDPVYPDDEP